MLRRSIILATITASSLAVAQPPPPPGGPPPPMGGGAAPAGGNIVGADAAIVIPTGDYAEGVNAALGVFGRFEFRINPQMFATGRIGFLYHLLEDTGDIDVSITMIPVYGGIRYNLSPSDDGVFFHGEAGLNLIRTSVDFMGESASESETKLSLNLGAGYQTGQIEARASIFVTPGVGGNDEANVDSVTLIGLMATVGFNFAQL